ncbi:bifunctional proline dehydrogenase/L-glutamate gamma-semialdehyde dehydrogenase PutA [Pseudoteredinibacter isoporae]|uniref:bifunctional proline dehydrogenase/L-glutamate gamma-semialdehyde dehydrogenase PutA n=1 Tax=Pseudoteredinibacter isoporae TaxID=570281 RepID=UPI0031064E65
MLYPENHSAQSSLRQQIRDAYRLDENQVVESLLAQDKVDAISRAKIWQKARDLILHIRKEQEGKGGVDALLQEFSLSTDEGIVLMCLAEALLRVPDKDTMDRLIRDKLSAGDWDSHLGNSDSLFVNASAWGLLLTGKMVSYSDDSKRRNFGILKQTMGRVGEPVIRRAVRYAMQIMGTQFVLGTTIVQALKRAAEEEAKGYRYSYDMLGEGARTDADAQRYFQSYMDAIESIGKAAANAGPEESPGISVKLSAIHPRYEFSHRQRVMAELVPRLKKLALAAKRYDIGFTVDAEEADRLDLSFDIIEAVYLDEDLAGWEGFGLAIQAYQKRAHLVIDWIIGLARKGGRRIMVRLVKGAYWDSEIKWSQEEGLDGYPVFTRKASTDVSYQVCAQKLLAARDCIYPQFATHNAYSVASILEMDSERKGFEFQRLHGMGEALYENMVADEGISCRIYAPVGEHADLLAYLVRRLLENGANSSFVNNIVDESIPVESLLEDPFATVESWKVKSNSVIPLPEDIFAAEFIEPRKNSVGFDLTDCNHTEPAKAALEALVSKWLASANAQSGDHSVVNPANHSETIAHLSFDDADSVEAKLQQVQSAQSAWEARPVTERAVLLNAMADALEQHRDEFLALCVKEAGKSIPDAVAEIREAVDFCRYYARQAEQLFADYKVQSRGVVLCISPWNFPLAIFLGQVAAALVTGNTVLAKPAEQTSLVALRCIELWREKGLPADALQLIIGPGKPVGEQLVPDARIRAVMFTGSTATGQWINQTLAAREDNAIPLVAETGGQNAIIVDSTALPEQVVDDVMSSGFQSAGQRCSALRVLYLQEDIADKVMTMIKGAMAELHIGDPQWLSTDVGPVIDHAALSRLQAHQARLADMPDTQARLHFACPLSSDLPDGNYFAPHLYELSSLDVLHEEVFGPVVHVIRFKSNELDDVIAQINRAGFGLTLGVHSRIEAVCDKVAMQAKVGNVYINRNIIGAVVGVQPFGGRGLSGTGPKAGGPAYLQALVTAKEISTPIELRIPEAQSEAGAERVMTVVAEAQAQWNAIGFDARLNQLRRLLANMANLESLPDLESMLESSQDSLQSMDEKFSRIKCLPGPTGESNLLGHDARGVLLAMKAEGQSYCQFFAPLMSSLLAGNGLLVHLQEADLELFGHLRAFAQQAEIPAGLICAVNDEEVPSVLSSSTLAGVIVPAFNTGLQRRLAARDGAILPQIQACDPFFEQRLLVEKTITTDTTAAGGNASLMSISED